MVLPNEIQVFLSDISAKYGGVTIKPKSSSALMRLIGWIFRITKISPQFMTNYYTTLGSTIYVPDNLLENMNTSSFIRTLAHETVHAADARRLSSALFGFLYLFPQSLAPLALLSLLGLLNPMFFWCLGFLVFLAPIPAPFRYWFELKAYRTQLLFARKEDRLSDTEMEYHYEWVEKQLCTKLYYWTWPFKSWVRRNLKNESGWNEGIYKDLTNWIHARRVVRQIGG